MGAELERTIHWDLVHFYPTNRKERHTLLKQLTPLVRMTGCLLYNCSAIVYAKLRLPDFEIRYLIEDGWGNVVLNHESSA
jgi:hypothetical protein